jgi:hypothetical protein
MVLQDLIISIINLILSISLIPEVYLGFRKRKGFITLRTSVPTTFSLYALSIVYYTLDLNLAALTSLFMATLWLLFLIQKIIYKKD